jgi:hypothetical protein
MKIIKYLGLLGAILGYIFNVTQYYELSYIIWLISNSLWLYYNYKIKEWEMFIMFIIYDGFCLYGLIK